MKTLYSAAAAALLCCTSCARQPNGIEAILAITKPVPVATGKFAVSAGITAELARTVHKSRYFDKNSVHNCAMYAGPEQYVVCVVDEGSHITGPGGRFVSITRVSDLKPLIDNTDEYIVYPGNQGLLVPGGDCIGSDSDCSTLRYILQHPKNLR